MARLVRWALGGLVAAVLSGCSESATSPSPAPPPLTRARIDFETLTPPSPPTEGMVQHGCRYSEDAYTIETLQANCSFAGGFVSVHMPPDPTGPNSINRYTGSVTFSNLAWFGVTRLTRTDGGTFKLVSIDLDTFNGEVSTGWPTPWIEGQTVTFTGTRPDGSTVTQAFTTDRVFPRVETFTFRTDFSDLVKVEWSQLGPLFHQFDNIVVASPAQ